MLNTTPVNGMRLAKFFGTSAEFWLGLQTDFDMAVARDSMGDALNRIARFEPSHAGGHPASQ